MKRRTRSLALALALPLAAAFAADAAADSGDKEGDVGRIVGLRVNTPGSSEHASEHGAITIRTTKGKRETYAWGGSTCPGQKLTAAEVELLAAALRGRTSVRPFFTDAKNGTQRCLVAFELRT